MAIKVDKTKKVMFTEGQMYMAKGTNKFKDHRGFVEHLFKKQCRCKVVDHALLKYRYLMRNKVCIVEVVGVLGKSLEFDPK